MPLAVTNATADSFNPSSLLSLYEIDSRYVALGGSVMYFHAGVNGLYQPVIFDGITYTPFPIEVNDMTLDGKGNPSRPKLVGSNINGFLSQFLLTQNDLVGARFVRRRVFARFLDGANFVAGVNPFGTPDPAAAYEDEVYFINRKISENPQTVEFELCTPFELDNVQLPRRPVLATVCTFIYRDPETCGYSGPPISDRFGKLFTAAPPDGYGYTLLDKGIWADAATYDEGDYVTVISLGDFTYGDRLVFVCTTDGTTGAANNPQFNQTNWIADACPHNLLGCQAHFPSPAALPLGAWPGTSRASYTA